MCTAVGHVRDGPGSTVKARKSNHLAALARRLGIYVSGVIPRAERALRRFPTPDIPAPYIAHVDLPFTPQLATWLWFCRYTWLLLSFIASLPGNRLFGLLSPYTVTALLLALGYCLLPVLSRRRVLSIVLWALAWAGHTSQTARNCIEIVRAADGFDCVLIAVLFAVVPRLTRFDPRQLVYPFTFARAPYIANRASQMAYITIAARRSPAVYFGLPLLYVGILIMLVYKEMRDDLRRRASLGPDPNRLNPAARIPPEVQLRIFHLVRARQRFSERDSPFVPTTIYQQELQPLRRWTGLAAGCTVCRAWRDAATEVLYSYVFLPDYNSVVAFVFTFAMRPELAQLVRRITFPVAWGIPSHAVQVIVGDCSLATDFTFFDAERAVGDIPGLALAAHRVRRLAITWRGNVLDVDSPAYQGPYCDVLHILEQFPLLESLELSRARIVWDDEVSIGDLILRLRTGKLDTLRLDACIVSVNTLMRLTMIVLSGARVVALRNMVISNEHQLGADVVFLGIVDTLTELDLSSTHARLAAPPVTLGALGAFTALRVLGVDAHALGLVPALPPALERLVLSFAPYSIMLRHTRRQRLFLTVDRLRRLLAVAPPSMRSVQIWDEATLAQTRDWAVAAFMLREMLGPSIDVEVNISLPRPELLWWRLRLSAQKSFRWLYM